MLRRRLGAQDSDVSRGALANTGGPRADRREIVSFAAWRQDDGLFAFAATRSARRSSRPPPWAATAPAAFGTIGPSDIEVAAAAEKGSIIVWGEADENRATGVTVDAVLTSISSTRWSWRPGVATTLGPPTTNRSSRLPPQPWSRGGMAALDTPIRGGCHRPERVAAIVGAGVEVSHA